MLSRKIRSFSALAASSVGIVMVFLVISQFVPYLVNDSWDILLRVAGKFESAYFSTRLNS